MGNNKNKLVKAVKDSFLGFFDKNEIGKESEILSVSCGAGAYEKLLFENYQGIKIVATDVVDCFVKKEDRDFFQATGRWSFVKVYPEKELPFPDNTFDVVYHNDVLEHVEKPFAFLKDQFRVLKPGGKIIIGTPNLLRIGNMGRVLFGQLDFPKKIHKQGLYTSIHHQQEFTEWNIVGFLKEIGFTEIEVKCSFFGLHFWNIQFQAFPKKGIGRLLSHYLTIFAIKPKIIS